MKNTFSDNVYVILQRHFSTEKKNLDVLKKKCFVVVFIEMNYKCLPLIL